MEKPTFSEQDKIISCRNQIKKNNQELLRIMKENHRLVLSLFSMQPVISPEKKARYDIELASDNWKQYSQSYKTKSKILD